ncbi:MAG: hypothetical protein HY261_00505 [Chloroflexi bacterium]|nr:hypothetical protein [Chloroflexota bacterium]
MNHRFHSPEIATEGPVAAIETCFDRGWTDGLPVMPPTPDRVAEFLDVVALKPDEVIGAVPTREVVITAEKVAINAVMAGCLPEYMPVVVAACRAMCDEPFNLHANSGTLSGAAQIVVVNGPIRKELGINSGLGVFGPGFRANATIGRAVRLVIRNVTRSIPGFLDRASFSQPGRFTWCFGENEEDSPWTPLHAERGLAPEASAVTLFAPMDPVKATGLHPKSPESFLERAAFLVRTVWTYKQSSSYDSCRSLLAVIGWEHMNLCLQAGWSKADIRNYLFPRLRAPGNGWEFRSPIASPDNILVVAAGGPAVMQSWFMVPFPSHGPVTRAVEPARRTS